MNAQISYIKEEIKDQYLQDNKPWIIGYSGGKDSTALLQLVWYVLKEFPQDRLTKKIHIVCNDTLVENPKIVEWVDKSLAQMKQQAIIDKLPIIVQKTMPTLDDTFWVNLIGRGYPTPNNSFRWCTDRLKIRPTSTYIKNQVEKSGEVIILLGTREDESSARKKSLQKHSVGNSRLSRHSDLQSAYTYKPIRYVTTDDIWEYLTLTPPPWTTSNKNLIALYRKANDGDCPLVIDNLSPSCGQSRFGCWVCTVVKKDKSMQAFIDHGEQHLEPLIEIRNWLADNRSNDKYRAGVLRNGGKGKGPYNIQTREFLLTQLLNAEKSSKEKLITHQELKAIQIIWDRDGYNRNVYKIYYQVYNELIEENIVMSKQDEIRKAQDKKISRICEKYQINADSVLKLLKKEKYKSLSLGKLSMGTEVREEIERELTNGN